MDFEITYGDGRVLSGPWEDLPDGDVQIVVLHQDDGRTLRLAGYSKYFLLHDILGVYAEYADPRCQAWGINDGIANERIPMALIPAGARVKQGEWVHEAQAKRIGLVGDAHAKLLLGRARRRA